MQESIDKTGSANLHQDPLNSFADTGKLFFIFV